jgi:hypothetical protein
VPAIEYKYAIVAGRRSPLISLGIGLGGRWQRVAAYVDSGAFYSVFKAGFAGALGIEWQKGEKVYVQVGDGGLIPIFLHVVDLQLRQYRFSGQIGFSEHLGVSFNLIGRVPLFEHCVVCFDDRQAIVRFDPYRTDES